MQFPRLLPVRQHFPDHAIRDVAGEVGRELAGSELGARLKPGSRVALGVGSRGIANIATIVRAVVDYWKSQGCRPFIFPAMGSHGAATAEGQASVLAHFGIDEAAMGCPVVSALDVVSLGKTADGIEAFMDRNAFESDGVMLIGRVKWHTDFSGKHRERAVQDDGHRAGQVRRRAALSYLRLQAGAGACDPQRWPASAQVAARSWAAWRFSKTPITTPRNLTARARPLRWSAVKKSCWSWPRAGWAASRCRWMF